MFVFFSTSQCDNALQAYREQKTNIVWLVLSPMFCQSRLQTLFLPRLYLIYCLCEKIKTNFVLDLHLKENHVT